MCAPECRPNGICPTCNEPTEYCAACDSVEVKHAGDWCDECEAKVRAADEYEGADTREEARCER
jgi:hypothetical protein